MQEIEKIESEEKPSENQASYSEESSTQVSAQILVPLITNVVYSISDLFLNFTQNILCMHLKSHMHKFLHVPCMHLGRQKGSRGHCIQL
jgi:hypothetical protein